MKKFLIAVTTALTFGMTAFLVMPKESQAQVACACPNIGTYKVFKIKKHIGTNTIVSKTNLGCLTDAEIAALPPIVMTDPNYLEYYQVGC